MLSFITIFYVTIFSLISKLAFSWCQQAYFQTISPINQILVSPSNRHIAIAHSDNNVRIYHASNYLLLSTYNVGSTINVIRFSPDGNYLAIGTTDSNVRFLQGYPPFGVAKTFDGFVGTEIIGIDFSPDLNHFIVCGGNSVGKLTLFNILSNGTWVNTTQNLVPASAIAKDCRFSYFNNRIIVNTATKLFIFDLTFSVIDNYNTPSVIYEKVAPDPISNLVEYIDSNHDILYDLNLTNRISTALVGNTNVLRTIDISSTGNYIASGGDDALVYIYNSDRQLIISHAIPSTITSVAFSMNSQHPKLFVGDITGLITVLAINCTSNCPGDQFYQFGVCSFCSDYLSKCLMCLSSTICDQCVEGCYVDPYSYVCKSCSIFGCISCINSGYCTGCQQGFYLSNNNCKRCALTLQGCAICNSSSICIACNNDYYLNASTNACKNCSYVTSNCLKCNNQTECIQCIIGFYKTFLGACSACDPICLNCQYSSLNCSQCFKGYYLAGYTCFECPTNCLSCNSTQFCFQCINSMYQKSDGTCASCVYPCALCQNATYCNACAQGYYLSSGICYACSSNCSTCNSSTYCSSCLSGYYLITASATCKACVLQYTNCQYCSVTACQSCQFGYFLNTSILCQHCSQKIFKCQKCSSSVICLSCIEGFYHTGLTGNSSCKSCSEGCQICWDGLDCKKCYQNYWLDPNLDCLPCLNNCLQCKSDTVCFVCDQGYYLETISQTCKLCKQTLNNCLECWNSSACIDCQIGYYLDSTDKKCKKCSVYCLTCSNSTSCFACVSGYFLILSGTNMICSPCQQNCTQCITLASCTSCKSGFYLDTATNKCINCTINRFCRQCNNITCFSCHSGYYLDNNNGLSPTYQCKSCLLAIEGCMLCDETGNCFECEYGYFLDGLTIKCKSCLVIDGCQDCINQNSCQKCTSGYFINSSNLCTSCPQGCSACNSAIDCTICSPRNYLVGQICAFCESSIQACILCSSNSICNQCMNGFYLDGTNHCSSCRSSLVGCLYCNNSLTCVTCQSGFYLDAVLHKCQICEKYMQGCEICLSSSACIVCESGYFIFAGGLGCNQCWSTLIGCSSCIDMVTCTICLSGYYLYTNNSCQTCNSLNSGCQTCSITLLNQFLCNKCTSGYFLLNNTCNPCQTIGCQICQQTNPSLCVNCDSGYFINAAVCIKCSNQIQGCNECTNGFNCIVCDVGYYLNGGICQSCHLMVQGCSKCTLNSSILECEQCKSSFLLDSMTKTCTSCSQVMQGCNYCVNSSECIACQNSYYKDTITNLCLSCTAKPGCLLCSSNFVCDYCLTGYFLKINSTIIKYCVACNESMQFCLACFSSSQCLTCQSGYELNSNKSQCQKFVVRAKQSIQGLKLITQYIDSQTLSHTLMIRSGQFQNRKQNLTGMCQLFLTDYGSLQTTTKISQIQLQIKGINYLSSSSLQFLTNNPTYNIISTTKSNKRLLTQNGSDLNNYKVSLQMDKDTTNKILPNIYQTTALILDYSLDQSQFYTSYLRSQGSIYQSYNILGYIICSLIVLNFIHKNSKIQSNLRLNHHFTGQIISHLTALKTVALFTSTVSDKLFYFCQGFMLIDIPWFNKAIGNFLGNKGDTMPNMFGIYYVNLNLASTSLVALVVFIILMSIIFGINDKNQLKRNKYTMLIYNIFIFGLIFSGSLSIQGAFFNPIKKFTINAIFYILGILVYLAIFTQMVRSISQQKKNLYKIRIFVKATLLSVSHINPIIVVSMTVVTDILLMVTQFMIIDNKTAKWIIFWFINHFILNMTIIIFLVIPNLQFTYYIAMSLISIVLFIEILLNCKLVSYIEQHPNLFSFKNLSITPIRIKSKGKQAIRIEQLQGNQDSLQTIIQGTKIQQNNEKVWQLNNNGIIESYDEINFDIQQVQMINDHKQVNNTRYNKANNEYNKTSQQFQPVYNPNFIQQQNNNQNYKISKVNFIKGTNKLSIRSNIKNKNNIILNE